MASVKRECSSLRMGLYAVVFFVSALAVSLVGVPENAIASEAQVANDAKPNLVKSDSLLFEGDGYAVPLEVEDDSESDEGDSDIVGSSDDQVYDGALLDQVEKDPVVGDANDVDDLGGHESDNAQNPPSNLLPTDGVASEKDEEESTGNLSNGGGFDEAKDLLQNDISSSKEKAESEETTVADLSSKTPAVTEVPAVKSESTATKESAAAKALVATKAPAYSKVDNGAYIIRTFWGKAVDVASASTGNGANVQSWSNNYTAAQRFYIQSVGQSKAGEWFYVIKNTNSGKVLDCTSGRKTPGTNIQQYSSNNSDAQHWYLRKTTVGGKESYQIVSLLSGLVLDVSGGSHSDGANIQIWGKNGTEAQAFLLSKCTAIIEDGAYVISTALPGRRVMDVASASPDNGAAIQTYAANGTLAQAFALTYDKSSGYYAIVNYASGRVVDVTSGSSNEGTPLQQYASNGTKAQKWQILKNANGTYTFVSAIGGKAIDVRNGSSSNGARLQQYTRNNTKAQQFTLKKTTPVFEGGTVMLRNGSNTYMVADVKDGSKRAGGVLQLYSPNYTFAQKYRIVVREDGYCTIRSIGSGLYVAASKSGALSQQKAGDASLDYLWTITPTKNGHFALTSVEKGIRFGVSGKASQGTVLTKGSSSLASSWNMLNVALVQDGLYTLASLKNANLVFDIADASLKTGANVRLWQTNGTNAQKFYIRHIGNDQYTIQSAWSALSLDVKNGDARSGSNVWQYAYNGSKAQKWRIVWDGAGGFVFKSALGSFSLGTASNVSNGSNVALKPYDVANSNQRFTLSQTTFKPLTMSDQIAVLDAIAGRGLNVFKSLDSLSKSTLNQLKKAIGNYESRGKSVSFLMMDLNSGSGISYGIDNKYYSASTIKGPYVAAVNKYYPWLINSWRNTMYDIINVSSNEAYAYLRHSVGDEPLKKLINDTHAWNFNSGSDYVWYSARDLAKLWVGVGNYLTSSSANAGWCRSVFGSNSWITSRPALSSKGCTVYAKSGWVDGDITVHNEGCIVMDGANPYLMVVMTTQTSNESWCMSNLMKALDRAHGDLT